MSLIEITPFKKLFGRVLDILDVRVFGCEANIHVPKEAWKRKLASRFMSGLFLSLSKLYFIRNDIQLRMDWLQQTLSPWIRKWFLWPTKVTLMMCIPDMVNNNEVVQNWDSKDETIIQTKRNIFWRRPEKVITDNGKRKALQLQIKILSQETGIMVTLRHKDTGRGGQSYLGDSRLQHWKITEMYMPTVNNLMEYPTRLKKGLALLTPRSHYGKAVDYRGTKVVRAEWCKDPLPQRYFAKLVAEKGSTNYATSKFHVTL